MRLIDADALLKDKVENAYISRFEIDLAPTFEKSNPISMGEYIRHLSDDDLAKFLSDTFCHGFGAKELLNWLNMTVEVEPQ